MICIHDVTDRPVIFGEARLLLSRANLCLEKGRYALCSRHPDSHRFVIDVLAGVRPPSLGTVTHGALVSWPLSRQGFVRGKASGMRVIKLICHLYGIDDVLGIDFVADLLTKPEILQKSMEEWPAVARQEFGFALALLPDFDAYIVDGALPANTSRFGRLWRALFEHRVVGRTLIFSTYRHDQMLDYCSKALVLEQGELRVEDDLELQLKRFPAKHIRTDESHSQGDMTSDEQPGEQLGL